MAAEPEVIQSTEITTELDARSRRPLTLGAWSSETLNLGEIGVLHAQIERKL